MTETIDILYETVGRFLSREQIRGIEKYLQNAGFNTTAEAFVGFSLIIGLLLSVLVFIVFWSVPEIYAFFSEVIGFFYPLPLWAIALFLLVFSFAFTYGFMYILVLVYLMFRSEARKMVVEATLPDFLSLMAANVRAGMTIDQSMWYAAKPEFGIFSREIRSIVKSSFSGEPFDKALNRLAIRFNSRTFERTLILIKQAMATGGEVADVLEMTAEDARETAIQKKEIASSLTVYEIFVVFASAVGTPFLFSVAGKLIVVLEKAFTYIPSGGIAMEQMGNLVRPTAPIVTSLQFFYFSIGAIFITTLFSSLILGSIKKGSRIQGIKYFPFLLMLSYIIFWAASSLLDAFFSGMLI